MKKSDVESQIGRMTGHGIVGPLWTHVGGHELWNSQKVPIHIFYDFDTIVRITFLVGTKNGHQIKIVICTRGCI